MTELHIACAADERYVRHSAAMLHSAITNSGCDVVAHYLHGPAFPREDQHELATMFARHGARIAFHQVADDRVAQLPIQELFGPAMWYRIFLPELLPELDRLLYLDVDTIVVDQLGPLWQLDIRDYLLGAVTNVFMPFHRHRPAELGIEPSAYFNSGVLLLNLELMRAEGFTRELYERATADPERLKWPDQDALNLVAGRRRLALHPRWNCMNSLLEGSEQADQVFGPDAVAEARASPAIRHFEGPGANKPWHERHHRAGRQLYRVHREATPWPDYVLEADLPAITRSRALQFETNRPSVRSVKPWHPLAYIARRLPLALESLAADLHCPSDGRVLDYGCADLPYRRFFADQVDYVAADLPGNPNASLTINEDGTVPLPDASVDAVISTQVLEHVQDPALYLSECHRVLRPGGRLLLSTHGLMVYHPDPIDYWRWTCAGLRDAVARSELHVERFEGIMGLGASGLQLVQDAWYHRLPRTLRPAWALALQSLIALFDRLEPAESRDRNALVFGLVAVKLTA